MITSLPFISHILPNIHFLTYKITILFNLHSLKKRREGGGDEEPGKMAQPGKAITAKPGDLSLTTRTHMMEEEN